MAPRLPIASRPIRYGFAICVALAILLASVVEPSEGTPRTLFGIGVTVYLHLFAYAALAATIGYGALATDRRTLLVAVALATLYGAVIELIQGQLPYRTMAASDVLLNAIGAAIGAALWRVLASRFGVDREGSSA